MHFTLKIINEKGLHARASAKFVETVEAYDAKVTVARAGLEVPGDSIMGLMTLGASRGTKIEVTVSGAQADEVSAALRRLVEDRFGEEF